MPVTPGQARILSLLIQTRDLDSEVVDAAHRLMNDDGMSFDECNDLITALVRAPENGESEFVVGGVVRG